MPLPQDTHLLVYCEGESEKQYVTALVERLQLEQHVTVKNPATSAPLSLLQAAFKDFTESLTASERKPVTEIWLVFDRDHHLGYPEMMRTAERLSPLIHFCWSNPCIEYWFWLHFTSDVSQLRYDDTVELEHREERRTLADGDIEVITTRKMRPSILPETMLRILTQTCGQYDKVKTPAGFSQRALKALENHRKVSQATDPLSVGTAFPIFVEHLLALAGALKPDTDWAAAFAPDPQPEPATPLLPDLTNDVIATLTPCMAEWPQLKLTPSCLEGPTDLLRHLELFFGAVAFSTLSAKIKLEANQALTTLANLSNVLSPGGTFAHKRYSKVKGRLDCLGTVLKRMATAFGLVKEAACFGPVKLASTPATGSSIPQITSADAKVSQRLQSALDVLRQCQKDVTAALSSVSAKEDCVPQETRVGACRDAADRFLRARWAVESCLYAVIPVETESTTTDASEADIAL